jgi:anaerobic selenocysteine-containing dehydrogenase
LKNVTACPLDCYDSCSIIYENDTIKGMKEGFTQGFLCNHLNHYSDYTQIEKPRFQGKEITMDEALIHLVNILKKSQKTLHFRGNGNFALMQEVTDYFFGSYGATLTDGSLCDGAGEAGIIAGRGYNDIMTPQQIEKSEVIVFWGRNPHTTSSHFLHLLKGKKIIVIDPVKTQVAQNADLHIQIKPHGDAEFALLLSRFLFIEGSIDVEFVHEYAPEFEEFYELTQTIRIKAVLDNIGASLGDIGKFLELVRDKKVAILCGVGIQKYLDGADVMRAIDAFGVLLGVFGKEGCGVSYLGSSKRGIDSPFTPLCKPKQVSKVDTKFGDFDTVFIQGSNPANQMPNTVRVLSELEKVDNLIYFGLYENQTSKMADLVIPAKTFLEKSDIRTSYATHYMYEMPLQKESSIGIGEYELTKYLCDRFDIKLEPEGYYLQHFRSFAQKNEEGILEIKGRDEISYQNGFMGDEFVFLDEFENDRDEGDELYLLTCKSSKSLNSQFRVDDKVYLHPSLGFKQNQLVEISSVNGKICLHVSLDERLREDCVLIYSGTNGVNNLTTSKRSYEGNSAVYQQNRVKVNALEAF